MDKNWYVDTEKEGFETPVSEYDITSIPNDFNISTIFSLIDNGVVKMPPFQRNYVWDEKRASKLIESIIIGLPIPQVFLYEQKKNSFYVIDGQQRLLSIYFFIKQRFPTKEGRIALRDYLTGDSKIDSSILSDEKLFNNFSLKLPALTKNETNKLDKLKFETLGDYKYTFEILRTIRTVVIKQNEPDNDSSIYEIFNRLNTGGQNLSPQEIRMSLYYSDFYKKLIEMNKHSKWRIFLNQDTPDIRLKDIEILVRVLAMLLSNKDYRSPMGKFLNTFSKKTLHMTTAKINYLEELFISFLKSVKNFPKNAFYSENGKFVISLFEAVFVAVCEPFVNDEKLVDVIVTAESMYELKKNSDFIAASQEGVASTKNVQNRISIAKKTIKFK